MRTVSVGCISVAAPDQKSYVLSICSYILCCLWLLGTQQSWLMDCHVDNGNAQLRLLLLETKLHQLLCPRNRHLTYRTCYTASATVRSRRPSRRAVAADTRPQTFSIAPLSCHTCHNQLREMCLVQFLSYEVCSCAPFPSSLGTQTSTLPLSCLSPSVACTLSVLLKYRSMTFKFGDIQIPFAIGKML